MLAPTPIHKLRSMAYVGARDAALTDDTPLSKYPIDGATYHHRTRYFRIRSISMTIA